MSKLVPKHTVLALSTGETVAIRPLNAFELITHGRVLAEYVKTLDSDADVLTLILDGVGKHQDAVAAIIAASCTKEVSWVLALQLEDLIAIAAEVISVNITAQKKTPALLAKLVSKLNLS